MLQFCTFEYDFESALEANSDAPTEVLVFSQLSMINVPSALVTLQEAFSRLHGRRHRRHIHSALIVASL